MPPTRVPGRQLRTLGCTAALAAAAVATAADSAAASGGDAAAAARAETRAARSQPVAMNDLAAAERVARSSWEPRPQNRAENGRTPSKRTLRRFRRSSQLPRAYKRRVTGEYRGTTDEIIQWAAYKWGFSPDVLRAVAAIESRWKMGVVGDDGQSFGIMQVKRGPHCCFPATRRSTAFNLDYYAAYLRAVYDGRMRWLNSVERGERYRRGDLWGSVGAWYSGRWHYGTGDYIRRVKDTIRQRVWRRSGFRRG
jgi:soluble lytic murein transglycosylase-like protein